MKNNFIKKEDIINFVINDSKDKNYLLGSNIEIVIPCLQTQNEIFDFENNAEYKYYNISKFKITDDFYNYKGDKNDRQSMDKYLSRYKDCIMSYKNTDGNRAIAFTIYYKNIY